MEAATSAGTGSVLNDIVTKLVAIALGEHPALGGRWEGDRSCSHRVRFTSASRLTRAQGLMVPVIRDVANLTLQEVATQVAQSDRGGSQA